MGVVRHDAKRAGELFTDFDDQESIWVGSNTIDFVDACSGVDGQTDPPVNGGRTGSRDDPGLEPFQHGLKAAKVCWHVVNGGSSVA